MTEDVDGIPVRWREPAGRPGGVALWLSHLGGSAQRCEPMLQRLATAGFAAVSFDPPGHGQRGTGDPWEFAGRVLAAFRRRMWPLLGRTTLECLRVLDWAQDRWNPPGTVVAGGVSMGGDVAVALAGIDDRVKRVSALAATPDWTRPHMHTLEDPKRLAEQGKADAYVRWFYNALDPMTHLDRYARRIAITFQSGARDRHVPAADALAFRHALTARFPDADSMINVTIHPDAGHLDIDDRFYDNAIAWLANKEEPGGSAAR